MSELFCTKTDCNRLDCTFHGSHARADDPHRWTSIDCGRYERILKPCPFCGGRARLNDFKEHRGGYVYCRECHASLAIQKTREEAIRLWNKRETG